MDPIVIKVIVTETYKKEIFIQTDTSNRLQHTMSKISGNSKKPMISKNGFIYRDFEYFYLTPEEEKKIKEHPEMILEDISL